MSTRRLKGHLGVRQLKSGKTRVYYAYRRDEAGAKHGVRLRPAHVRDSGRRSSRGAIVWRAGDGPWPTAEHLTPQDAEARLEELLRESEAIQAFMHYERTNTTKRYLAYAPQPDLAERLTRALDTSAIASGT